MMQTQLAEDHSLRTASIKSDTEGLLLILHTVEDIELFPAIALESVLTATHAAAGSFFLWDETENSLVLKSAQGPYRDKISQSQSRLQEGIIGWVGVQGASILVKDIAGDERFNSMKRNGQYRSSSFISIPLNWDNQLLGVINITERENLLPFSEEDHKLAQSFAHHISVAYHRLRKNLKIAKERQALYEENLLAKHQSQNQEALASIGKLALNLTHELNNPLDAIRRYVNLALDQSKEDPLAKEYLLKAKDSIRRAIRVMRHLMHYSAAHKPALKPIEIHDLIQKSLENLSRNAHFKKITVVKKLSTLPAMVFDYGLQLVLQNLYENASHAMTGEGVMTVHTVRANDKVIIRICDTGHGIPKEVERRLFEPFFSTKKHGEGLGLGLSICREVVERSGGVLTCENLPMGGACFTITLPCQNKGEFVS